MGSFGVSQLTIGQARVSAEATVAVTALARRSCAGAAMPWRRRARPPGREAVSTSRLRSDSRGVARVRATGGWHRVSLVASGDSSPTRHRPRPAEARANRERVPLAPRRAGAVAGVTRPRAYFTNEWLIRSLGANLPW